jgi:hypothetical protein
MVKHHKPSSSKGVITMPETGATIYAFPAGTPDERILKLLPTAYIIDTKIGRSAIVADQYATL